MLGIAPSKFFVVMSHIDDGDEPQLYNHIFTNKREANTLLRWLVRTDEERNITDYDYEVLTLAEAIEIISSYHSLTLKSYKHV